MTLKKLLIFPAVGMGLVLLAMIFGIAAVANEGLGSAATVMYIGVSLSALIRHLAPWPMLILHTALIQ